ncbi:hypothetical protein GJV85_02875 [Sulfurimonas aquatica]|uniref:Uncharacterized protein n=1 Tax=Sulfurimonas aquatica TaxID=2672570 RepID=A0A975AZ04_9BACT|nr:hypothetical protein [Sulfurimonas aquatica]QSZ41103.1 hypothetical protein GJV85_02875 [Sulfurimonas aquatica]
MLDSTVWRQHHKDNSFRRYISEFCIIDEIDLLVEDKELYSVLKAKLTKKELKLFAMDCANVGDDTLKKEFSYDDAALEKAKFKLYKKLKQDKTRLDFKESSRTREG